MFFKTIKVIFSLLLVLLITLNLFIVLSGRFYLYKGITNTYLVGKTGPSIYDLRLFPYSKISSTKKSVKAIRQNDFILPLKYDSIFEELDTKAFLVFKSDTMIYERYWGEHNKDTVSNSFSVAKTLVSILVGVAIKEGYINSIDDPVSMYFSEFSNSLNSNLTLRHLLSMSSGLDWDESGKNPFSDNAESYYGSDLRGLIMRKKIKNIPGKMFRYQSGNTQLLAYVIESATGKDLTKYAEEKIWRKIGLEHDLFWSLDKEDGDEKAFCCIYATARDYAKLGLLLLNKGVYNNEQIIPEWYYNEMVSPQNLITLDGTSNYRYGLHIWTYLDPKGKVNYCRGMRGQYIITIPKENIVIVRLGAKSKKRIRVSNNDFDEISLKLGHSPDLFDYINLAKLIASEY
ncbi:MAG: serine hydrolase [Crocinitomicaceae bacterium]|nr:serine hydrolase [Crocinitomicaceae bacterium]MBB79361.1 serine hydrolase [Crocinitomicaceae bacterium]|tara:strand:- start:2232 stop:3434 length:1203 start_codon:yes stop_codon:yes gene_type:complete